MRSETVRTSLVAALAVLVVAPAGAQTDAWNIDASHTAAQFSVRHMMVSTVDIELTRPAETGTAGRR